MSHFVLLHAQDTPSRINVCKKQEQLSVLYFSDDDTAMILALDKTRGPLCSCSNK